MIFDSDIARKIAGLRSSLVGFRMRESSIYRLWQNLKANAEKEYMPNILLGLWPVMRENFAKLANEQGSKLAFVKKKIEEIQAEIERLLRLPDDPEPEEPEPDDPKPEEPEPEEPKPEEPEPDEPESDDLEPTDPQPEEPEEDPESGNSTIQGKATI